MFSCCNVNGFYLNGDGSVDFKAYLKCVEESIKYRLKDIEERGRFTKTRGIPEYTFNEDKICKCRCHSKKDGMNIMH